MFSHVHLESWLHAMQKIGFLIFLFVFVLTAVRAFLTPKKERSRLKSIPLRDLKETPRAAKPPRHEN